MSVGAAYSYFARLGYGSTPNTLSGREQFPGLTSRAAPMASVTEAKEWMRDHGMRPGLKFAAALSIMGFVLEDMAMVKLLRTASEHMPHGALSRAALDTGMIALLTANNYVASRAVVGCVQYAAGKTSSPEEAAGKLTQVFETLEEQDAAKMNQIRNPILRAVRKAAHNLNPLTLIKNAAGRVGAALENRSSESRFVKDSAYVNMYGVPWATLALLEEGETITRGRSLSLAANFAGWWVVGAEVVDGINHIPKVGNALGMPFGWAGQLIDPLSPTDVDVSRMPDHLPLGPLGTVVGASMAYKGLHDSARAGAELNRIAA